MAKHLLSRRGRLWAWTTQEFPPPAPPYTGPSGAAFVPYGVGYVELADEVRVETRLTKTSGLTIGMDMELVLVPFRTDADGNEVAWKPGDQIPDGYYLAGVRTTLTYGEGASAVAYVDSMFRGPGQ